MHLYGREREHADVVDRLEDHRVVTVVGPGGIGKTALARAVAADQGQAYALGAHFVDLARVETGEAVGAAMASQLGFASFRALLDSSSDQPVLLVVDNCEHVLDDAAEALDALLGACMAPAVVATSRSPLDLPEESVVVLGPLAQAGASGASVDLFLARAKEAGATLSDDQAEAVGALCAALDGVPLALEIAAARTRVLTPAEIHDRLDDLDTLSRPKTRGAERHRTVRTTIEWSYRQLDDDEQRFFDRLGIFTGAFTAATAHDVAGEPDEDAMATLERLESLVRASLVTAEAGRDRTCYRLLHIVRTFAREQLHAREEDEATARRFVAHLLATTAALGPSERNRWDAGAMTELLDRADDVFFGLRWTAEHDPEADASLTLLTTLWPILHEGRTDELAAAGERVLGRWPEATGPAWADAMATLATAWHLLGRSDDAVDLAEQGLAAADGARLAPVTLQRVLGQARAARDDTAGALEAFAAGEAAALDRGLAPLARELGVYRAVLESEADDVDAALAALRDARTEAAAAGDVIVEVWAQVNEGYLFLDRDPAQAATTLQAALDLARAKGYRAGTMTGLLGLALAAVVAGQPGDGAPLLVEVIDEITLNGAVADLSVVLHVAAALLLAAGRDDIGPLVATSQALPRVSFFGPATRRLLPLPDTTSRALSTGGAISWSRAALEALEPVAAPHAPDQTTIADDHGRLRLHGSLWHLTWAGQDLTMRASKGMADLARLLGSPDEEVHCLELAGAAIDQGSTGDVLDATARRAYEDRIRELQTEIDEAEADNDLGRSDRAQIEFDALVEQLASALGLGGRARQGGSTAERARSAVTHRIRSTIRKIGSAHPDLGRHLEASIRTGTYCSYRPERPTTWTP